jgi:hypothetical protein
MKPHVWDGAQLATAERTSSAVQIRRDRAARPARSPPSFTSHPANSRRLKRLGRTYALSLISLAGWRTEAGFWGLSGQDARRSIMASGPPQGAALLMPSRTKWRLGKRMLPCNHHGDNPSAPWGSWGECELDRPTRCGAGEVKQASAELREQPSGSRKKRANHGGDGSDCGSVIAITVIAMRVRYSDLAGERRYSQHAFIGGLVGPVPNRRPERAHCMRRSSRSSRAIL